MSKKEEIIAEATAKAQTEAKKKKLNAAQTKLFVEEAVKKAIEEIETVETVETVETAEETVENTAEDTAETTEPTVEEPKKLTNVQKAKTQEKEKVQPKKKGKYIVYTPVPNFVGIVAGVHFAYGKAEVKPGWILQWFKEHGYKIEEVSE